MDLHDPDDRDAVFRRPLDRELHGELGGHLAERPIADDQRSGAEVTVDDRALTRQHLFGPDRLHIVCDLHGAVGVDAAQVRAHEVIGDLGGV